MRMPDSDFLPSIQPERGSWISEGTLVALQIDPLEEIFVADMVNLHAFMDEQSFGLLNHWTPST